MLRLWMERHFSKLLGPTAEGALSDHEPWGPVDREPLISNPPLKGIRLDQDKDGGVLRVFCGGRVSSDDTRRAEDSLNRALDRAESVVVIFQKDCDGTSALIGLVMRLNTRLKTLGKPLRVNVGSARVRRVMLALRLDEVLAME